MVEMERAGPDNTPLGFSARHWQAICEETVAGLRGWHEKNPDRAGPSLIAMRQQMTTRIPVPVFEGVVAALVADKQVINLGSSFCLPGFEATMSMPQRATAVGTLPCCGSGRDRRRTPRFHRSCCGPS